MKTKILTVLNIVAVILLLWFTFSFVEVTAKNLSSEKISDYNAFAVIASETLSEAFNSNRQELYSGEIKTLSGASERAREGI